MNNERVTPKNAAKELQMDVITLRELMKREKLPIGYAIKREGKSKWGFYIYRHLLDQEKERLNSAFVCEFIPILNFHYFSGIIDIALLI